MFIHHSQTTNPGPRFLSSYSRDNISVLHMHYSFLFKYRNYLKECPGLNECLLLMSVPLHSWKIYWAPRLKWGPPQTRKGELIWKSAMSSEELVQIVCKNDKFPSVRYSSSDNDIVHSFFVSNQFIINGSSPPEVFLRKGVLKIWSKFTGEH